MPIMAPGTRSCRRVFERTITGRARPCDPAAMASLFTRMMAGLEPARLVHEDEACVALMAPAPIRPGHVILVPRLEVDDWVDLPPELAARLAAVAQRLGSALRAEFPCEKVGLAVLGLEVRHAHLHLVPISSAADLDFTRPDRHPDPAALDAACERVRRRLEAGHS
jgi:histidine triad (HIT) family protein